MYAQIDGNEIKLYGTIYSGDARWIISDTQTLLKNNADVIVRLHTPGGDVFDGNLIYNHLVQSKAKIHVIVDGIAASMGFIIMLAGDKISIVENGFAMAHAPWGSVTGTSKDFEQAAKMCRNMEDSFLKKIAAKSGKTVSALKYLMDGDNWFSAQEAMDNGFIDHIIDPVFDEDFSAHASGTYNFAALAKGFEAYDKKPEPPSDPTPQPPNKHKVKLNSTSLAFLGLEATATEQDINAAIAKAKETNEAQAKELKDLKDAQAAALKKQIDAKIAEFLKNGRITAAEEADYRKGLESNFELTASLMDKIPAKKGINSVLNPESNTETTEDRSKWTAKDWRMKDTPGYLRMKTEDPERFKQLAESDK